MNFTSKRFIELLTDAANTSADLTSYETPAKGSSLEKKRPMTARKWTERVNDGTPAMVKEDETATAMKYLGDIKKFWKNKRDNELIKNIEKDYRPRYTHRLAACKEKCEGDKKCVEHCHRVHHGHTCDCDEQYKNAKERLIDAGIGETD